MPIIIKIEPQVTHLPQAAIIADATPRNDGVMTKEQAALLQQLAAPAFLRTISQPVDGSDFQVTVPAALQLGTSSYQPVCSIMTPNTFTGIAFDLASQTASSFRVTTDGTLPDGTVLLFSLRKVA